jgi:SpoVK/Ycf46/Vps4 family AAA+-type ATPase
LLIIDEADHLIASRDRLKLLPSNGMEVLQQQQQQHVGSHCLFALLEGVRESNQYVSLMLTTRLTVDQIDPALLDRMDKLIHFPLPTFRERLLFILEHLKDQVKEFISDEKEKVLIDKLNIVSGDISGVSHAYTNNKERSDQDVISLLQDMMQSLSVRELKTHLRNHDIQQRVSRFVRKTLGGQIVEEDNVASSANQSQSQQSRSVDPELDHQPATIDIPNQNLVGGLQSSEDLHQLIRIETVRYLEQQLANGSLLSDNSCNVELCVKAMVLCSHGWSYRDLQKRLMNLRYSVLCSER